MPFISVGKDPHPDPDSRGFTVGIFGLLAALASSASIYILIGAVPLCMLSIYLGARLYRKLKAVHAERKTIAVANITVGVIGLLLGAVVLVIKLV